MTDKIITKAKVLVIDEVPENITALSEDLTDDGYSVISAANGIDGINLAKQHRPDIILLEMTMPDIDGLKMCRILKNDPLTSEIPIILISAREDIDHIIDVLDNEVTDYILKPFQYSVVAAKVQSTLGKC